ncbi:Glycosyl transferases group 1 [Rhizobium sp. NFR07]|uniref:glycosyltransferase n=1 Tax=Rhizobium sp. NFR07 TaxID=1566262 RepID=UPI0008ED6E6F|nr:glycosyltransferase [Rhizobium sp. NFR07]SFB47738.1 Glycosyl transferases group 1 [Rhizobium sp. NFR07]
MKVHHYHFGKDGGAEKFFVHLVGALGRRGVEQSAIIRPDRIWRKDIAPYATIIESNFRNLSPDRLLLPIKATMMARREKPDALMSWATRASRLMPAYKGCIKLSRLGDYPTNLSYFKNTDTLVCNTPGIAEHVRHKLGWDRGVEVISNFTNTEKVLPVDRAAYDTPADVPLVMSMGRFVRRKGFHTLIEAVAQLPHAWLWLAGDGEERQALEGLVREKGMQDRVRFLGWQKDTRAFVAAADVYVMASDHEPLGNVILEAWAQEKPVVSSKSEGPVWFMRDGENGRLVDIGDATGFATAIGEIVLDAKLARSLAEGGHRTLMAQFSEEAIAGAYIDLFKSRPR